MEVSNKFVPRLNRMEDLPYHFGLKMRCYPSYHQQAIIKLNGNNDRFLYNRLVAINRYTRLYRQFQIRNLWKEMDLPFSCKYRRAYWDVINMMELRFHLINWQLFQATLKDKQIKEIYPWFKDPLTDSLVPKTVRIKFRKALHMMKVVNHHWPSFHKKSYQLSYQTSCSYIGGRPTDLVSGSVYFMDHHHIRVPKIGRIRVAGSQQRIFDLAKKQLIRIGTVTIRKNSDDTYEISLALASNQPFVNVTKQMKHRIEEWKILGIDLNLKNFLTASDGTTVDNPRFFAKAHRVLKRRQHALSRKQRRAKKEGRALRSSKNYQQNRIAVAKLQRHVKNQRNNFLNILSYHIIKNHDLVVTENLRSKNLLKNHALANRISDVGWRTFIQDLNYKAELYNKLSVQVAPNYTTQVCSNCSFRMGTHGSHKLTLDQREWTCPSCGAHHLRDYNASLNILAKGINQILVESNCSKKIKQAKKTYLGNRDGLAKRFLKLQW